jgi:hypothetical protein|nr:MAG TPA: hypothetical protein [Caudoviricetes sp.]
MTFEDATKIMICQSQDSDANIKTDDPPLYSVVFCPYDNYSFYEYSEDGSKSENKIFDKNTIIETYWKWWYDDDNKYNQIYKYRHFKIEVKNENTHLECVTAVIDLDNNLKYTIPEVI